MADDLDPAVVERAADLLDWLADARAEYEGGPEVLVDALPHEVATARTLARALRDPEAALGWLPSWKWDEYRAALAAARDGGVTECAHPGGGDVDKRGLCAWHRPAAPTVTAESVERLARQRADDAAVSRGGEPWGDDSWAHVRHGLIRVEAARLRKAGIEVREP